MVEVERRAVVDEPEPVVPEQQVRVLGRAIDVRHERVEPDDVGREPGIGRGARRRAERKRGREEVDAEVRARARHEEVLDLGVRLRPSEHRVELDEREPRHEEPEGPRELAGDDLRDERFSALSCAAELEDVEAVVARLDERGQGAAFAERRDVAGGGDVLELHGPSLTHPRRPTPGSPTTLPRRWGNRASGCSVRER